MKTSDITDLQVLQSQQRWLLQRDGPWGYEILERETGIHSKVCWRAFERAEKRGLLEYGVSLRTAWITEKGKELLRQHELLQR